MNSVQQAIKVYRQVSQQQSEFLSANSRMVFSLQWPIDEMFLATPVRLPEIYPAVCVYSFFGKGGLRGDVTNQFSPSRSFQRRGQDTYSGSVNGIATTQGKIVQQT